MRSILGTLGVVAVLAISLVQLKSHFQLPSTPKSILMYEAVKQYLPESNFNLSLCKLLAKAHQNPEFFASASDQLGSDETESCSLEHVTLAYGGWCWKGVLDKTQVHFAQAILPYISVKKYREGTVIRVNHYAKALTQPDRADELAAQVFFRDTLRTEGAPTVYVSGLDFPLFIPGYLNAFPFIASEREVWTPATQRIPPPQHTSQLTKERE